MRKENEKPRGLEAGKIVFRHPYGGTAEMRFKNEDGQYEVTRIKGGTDFDGHGQCSWCGEPEKALHSGSDGRSYCDSCRHGLIEAKLAFPYTIANTKVEVEERSKDCLLCNGKAYQRTELCNKHLVQIRKLLNQKIPPESICGRGKPAALIAIQRLKDGVS